MHLLADQAADYAQQTVRLGNGEDIVKVLLESLAETEKSLNEIALSITDDINKAIVSQGPVARSKDTLEKTKSMDPIIKKTALESAPLQAKGVEEKVAKIKLDGNRLRTLLNGASQSIPPKVKSNPLIKGALDKMGTSALQIIQAINKFEKDAELVVTALRQAK
jgi:hypothetical protein